MKGVRIGAHVDERSAAGRPSADTVTSLGSTGLVDGSVRRIGSTYDGLGRVQTVTSYSDTSGAAALTQVKYEYNGWGRVSKEYQEHDGVVDTGSLSVQYTYADGASDGVAKYARLSNVVYPNGRNLHYGYGTAGAIDDIMSRLSAIYDDANDDGDIDPGEVYAAYQYLGAGRIVTEDYAEPQVKLDYTANNLAPLDRFGRVTDQVWADYGTTPETFDEYTYSYDRAGNRTARTNELRSALSETYQYNGVDALVSSVRNDSFDQSWTLDGLGNWSGFSDDGSSQARTANAANEIGSITGGWATPAYDPAGNMTVIPAPLTGDADHALGAKYDAWNHLVETSDGSVLVAKFVYDGAGRRIEQLSNYVGGVPQQATHYYLSGQNQVLETREGLPASSPESLSPKYQNVWSPRYIDALVLRDSYSGGVLQPASRLYYLSDANYNVTAVVGKVNDTWQAVERYAYTAYGKAAIYTPDWSSTRASSLYGNATLYTGRELDAWTSLYYYRARYYSADLGAFVGRDPIGYQGGINLYEYVSNAPLTHTDPSGLQQGSATGNFQDLLGLDERTSSLLRTRQGQVQLALETLCNSGCSGCSKSECMDEAKAVSAAYVDMFHKTETRSFPRFGFRDDHRRGWMCYQWQTHTFNALEPIVKKGKCFDIRRVGLVAGTGDKTSLEHNWVAISSIKKVRKVTDRTAAGKCTVYLDPWMGNGPEAYCNTGVGYEKGHPRHNFLGEEPLGEDPSKPEGMGGYYTPAGGQPCWKEYPRWSW